METFWFGIASGVISFTVAEMNIFEWLRNKIENNKFFGQLIHCHFCLSFWTSAAICLIYQPNLIDQINILDQIITYFIVCGISGLTGLVFKVLYWITERAY